MLANLDNEVHFKHVFTDVEVFSAFAKDVLGIELNIDKVETEKVLPSKISAIKFRMDLFAEDKDNRTVVEIQKVDYDYSYDRFAHYFLANIIDMQKSSRDYSYDKDVYIIVVVTAAYRISELNGRPIKDDVLVTSINPRNLQGHERQMTNHQMVILNTTYVDENTPQDIKDWMDLIKESMHNREHPNININKPGIARAAQLAEVNDLSPEQLAESKIMEMRKVTIALVEDSAIKKTEEKMKKETQKKIKETEEKMKKETQKKIKEAEEKAIMKAIKRGKLTLEEIAEDYEVNIAYVKALKEKIR